MTLSWSLVSCVPVVTPWAPTATVAATAPPRAVVGAVHAAVVALFGLPGVVALVVPRLWPTALFVLPRDRPLQVRVPPTPPQ